MEGQLSLFDMPEEDFTQEEIDKVISIGGGFERSQVRIYHWFMLHKTQQENVRWLRQEYGIGGMYPVYPAPAGQEIGLDYRSECLRIWRVKNGKHCEKKISWEYMERHIRELVENGTYMTEESPDFPCLTCIFDKRGVCQHNEDCDWYCENGSFRITEEQAMCPKCGHRMIIIQDDMGSDGGQCNRCGTRVIFNNQGNRPSAWDLWKEGKLVGT